MLTADHFAHIRQMRRDGLTIREIAEQLRAPVGHTCVSSGHGVGRGGLIDRGIEPPGDASDGHRQGRGGPRTAQLFVMLCGACSSPPDVSTTVTRSFGA